MMSTSEISERRVRWMHQALPPTGARPRRGKLRTVKVAVVKLSRYKVDPGLDAVVEPFKRKARMRLQSLREAGPGVGGSMLWRQTYTRDR